MTQQSQKSLRRAEWNRRNPFAAAESASGGTRAEPEEPDYAPLGLRPRATTGIESREVVSSGSQLLATPRGAKSVSRLPDITDPATVRRVFDWQDICCPLPGHGSLAELVPLAEKGLVLECDCMGGSAPWEKDGWRGLFHYCLAGAFYAIRSGTVLDRGDRQKKGQRLVWRLLLTHEAGLIEPVAVALPGLPPEADALQRQAREFFALLAGLRLRIRGELTMPFPDRLLAAWFGVRREGPEARSTR